MKSNMAKTFESAAFRKKYHYAGRDLGAAWRKDRTRFRVWAPLADEMALVLHRHGIGGSPAGLWPMRRSEKGTWTRTIAGDWAGVYYTYRVRHGDRWDEAVDPYALAVGANGHRAMIVDPKRTNPPSWSKDRKPRAILATDAVIYELHVRDATIHPSSGAKHRGKFLGLTERGLRGPGGVRTGLDHMRELGVTHVHLLPSFDFASIDETKPKKKQYNWGYDPQHYSVPEGSYSTDPFHGEVRIREFKRMVAALHRAGIRVVMDVVYNHTYRGGDSHFHKLVPGYYHRQDAQGGFSNGSGCGNEVASDRSMVRKMIVDSLVHWAREYHIDGFRFDLMGLHDLETMREVRRALDRVDRSIILYGEGWTGGDSPLPPAKRATKTNVRRLNRVAAFSDNIRDGIKGPVWDRPQGGFVQGFAGREETIKAGVVASTAHPQVAYPKGDAWKGPWAAEPFQCVTYESCHDNHTLWDKLLLTTPAASERDRIAMNKLAAAVVLTSQGIAFLHAGEELLRTKHGEENSYNKPDSVNQIDWRRKLRRRAVFEYYRGLVAIRHGHPALRMPTAAMIRRHLAFLPVRHPGVVAFIVAGHANGDPAESLAVVYNANRKPVRITVPSRRWSVLADGTRAGAKLLRTVRGGEVEVAPISALIMAAGASR